MAFFPSVPYAFVSVLLVVILKLGVVWGQPPLCGPIIEANDTGKIQFALNLEFLEAEYFLCGATGRDLDSINSSLSQGGPPPIGCQKANLDPLVNMIIEEFGYQEVGHVRYFITCYYSKFKSQPASTYRSFVGHAGLRIESDRISCFGFGLIYGMELD